MSQRKFRIVVDVTFNGPRLPGVAFDQVYNTLGLNPDIAKVQLLNFQKVMVATIEAELKANVADVESAIDHLREIRNRSITSNRDLRTRVARIT